MREVNKQDFVKKLDWPNLLAFCLITGTAFLFLHFEIKDFRNELKTDISQLRIELKKEISDVKTELKLDISEVRKDVNDLQQRMAIVETVLKINYSIAQKPVEEKK